MVGKHGLVQVYTGNGRGKTSAAWGQVLRAVGRGWKVAVVCFLKPNHSGELEAAARFGDAIAVFGETSPYDPCMDQKESDKLREESRENFKTAKEIISSGEWEMVVLDEMNLVLHYGFVSSEEMIELLNNRPQDVEIVITGRYAPEWLVQKADLVTEMLDIKHPSAEGIEARRGIEY